MTPDSQNTIRELDIAIIGMSGRFPGAANIDQFWQNLRDGVESIAFPSEQELLEMGVSLATMRRPGFVKACPLLARIDSFDASFFGYSPREAELVDPQHRLFLECAWESLESAGYQPDEWPGLIGVYAGTSLSSYLIYNLLPHFADMHAHENLEMMIGNDKDFLSTRVAYKLNLTGPAITVQTGCSSSLVAIHLACQALLDWHCDMALAGGVSVHVPQKTGYYCQENGVTSLDGHCRPFDAHANGTLFGSGVGIVVLKRLTDAVKDGDTIHAVIKGSAINNDGSRKVGYAAPSVEGQRSVILAAQAIANVSADTISYVECHGTATALGDPVEVQALTRAFRAGTERTRFCGLGSVKSNIGHLDAAAGVAGVVKTILSLKHRALPPSLHFESPNPKLDLESSPFYVNQHLRDWNNASSPLRAAVSSFGVGGTNSHLILEEAPGIPPSGPSRDFQLLTLSAKTPSALDSASARLANHLQGHPEIGLPDAAYTLACGRKTFPFRRVAVCSDTGDAVSVLEKLDPARVFTLHRDTSSPIAFMFPGGGAQYANMGRDLYRSEETFRQQVDLCAELLRTYLSLDIREYLFPTVQESEPAGARIKEPRVGLSALFAVEYALAKLWIHWGIHPEAFIGYSLGEYTAACLAGVFSLEDALAMVATRGKLFEELPVGAMAAVPLSSDELAPMLGANLSIAAINSATQCIVSGPKEEVDLLVAKLAEQDVQCRRVQVVGAGHCPMVEPILEPFRNFLRTVRFQPPQVPYLSNLTGTWITSVQAMDPDYWVQHLRQSVLFGAGIKELLRHPTRTLLEVGPGHTLTSIVASPAAKESHTTLPSMRHPYDHQSDVKFLLTTLGRLWLTGARVDWHAFYEGERRMRTVLPSYPFERQRYWIGPKASSPDQNASLEKIWDVNEWFHVPSWRALPTPSPSCANNMEKPWLVFAADDNLSSLLIHQLTKRSPNVVIVRHSSVFRRIDRFEYEMNLSEVDHYVRILNELRADSIQPHNILHLQNLEQIDSGPSVSALQIQRSGLYSLVFLAKALAQQPRDYDVRISIVTTGLLQIESSDRVLPGRMTLLAPAIIIPQEYENISCRCIDVNLDTATAEIACDQVLRELESPSGELVGYRGTTRWIRTFEPVQLAEVLDSDGLFAGGTYLITGGLGHLGLQLAAHIAKTKGTRIALLSRSRFPERETWPAWLQRDGDTATTRRIRRLMALETEGTEILLLSADVADIDQMKHAIQVVQSRWGGLNGVIHLAGITGESAMNLISDITTGEFERQLHPKAKGLEVLEAVVAPLAPRFCVLFSSTAAVLGGIGSVAYTAANLFLDSFAQSRATVNGTRWISLNWDGWLLQGEEKTHSSLQTSLDRYAMTPEESWQCFCRVVAASGLAQIVVSTGNLTQRLKLWLHRSPKQASEQSASHQESTRQVRTALGTPFVAPSNELEQAVLSVWKKILGTNEIGIHDNFFDLGGNSLVGMKMIAELRRVLNIEIPLMALFKGPTVFALCEVIQNQEPSLAPFEESRERGLRRREDNVRDEAGTVTRAS